ncbi:MAG: fumarylacetoacetate hydrolase family protein [Bacteroidales bacterium]|nr:fumarylacetoacetate hydrolase family protein [Bacteroidales bacterium]
MKIICIGRNYVEHARELSNPLPDNPVFFLKPDTALVIRNRPFYYPDFSKDIHYETELVLKICKVGKSIPEKYAQDYYDQIGLGFDFTARDLQQKCKEKGLPWEIAKGFDYSAPISPEFVLKENMPDLKNISFHLELNGKRVQEGHSDEMIFSFEKIIAYVSQFMTLRTGDLIFTGTPAGVGPVEIGDKLEAYLEGNLMLTCNIK